MKLTIVYTVPLMLIGSPAAKLVVTVPFPALTLKPKGCVRELPDVEVTVEVPLVVTSPLQYFPQKPNPFGAGIAV
jgi:hypothetical protein